MEHHGIERLGETGQSVGRRVSESAQELADRAQGQARWVAGRAQAMAGDLVADADARVARMTGRPAEAWAEDLRRFVQQHPLQAIAITIGVGYVLGKLMRRD